MCRDLIRGLSAVIVRASLLRGVEEPRCALIYSGTLDRHSYKSRPCMHGWNAAGASGLSDRITAPPSLCTKRSVAFDYDPTRTFPPPPLLRRWSHRSRRLGLFFLLPILYILRDGKLPFRFNASGGFIAILASV